MSEKSKVPLAGVVLVNRGNQPDRFEETWRMQVRFVAADKCN